MATPGSRDSINTAGTQDWVVTFRKLLHKVTNQDAQIKALKANHKNLVLEAASLQHALAKAEIIPTGELLTSLLSLDPRSDSEGCSPGVSPSTATVLASKSVLAATETKVPEKGSSKVGNRPDPPPKPEPQEPEQPQEQEQKPDPVELSLNQVWEPAPISTLAYRGRPSFVDSVQQHNISKHEQKDLWEMCKPLLDGTAPLATQKARLQAVQQIIKISGVAPERWLGPDSPVVAAVNANHIELTHIFLRAKADPNVADHRGVTVLHLASFNGNITIARGLINHFADVNSRDPQGQTPVFFASRTGICKVLVEKKADLKVLNVKGQSALHLVAHNGFIEVLNWLSARVPRSLVDHHDVLGATAELCLRQRAMVRKDAVSLDRHDMGYKSRRVETGQLLGDKDVSVATRRFSMVGNDEPDHHTRSNSIERMYEELAGGGKTDTPRGKDSKKASKAKELPSSEPSEDAKEPPEGGASAAERKGASPVSSKKPSEADKEAVMKLGVQVVSAKGIPQLDVFAAGKTKAYVTVVVSESPDEEGHSFTTPPTAGDHLNPEFNASGEIPGFRIGEASLEFQVWNQDEKTTEMVAKGTVTPEFFQANSPQGFERDLELENLGEEAGTLAIKVSME